MADVISLFQEKVKRESIFNLEQAERECKEQLECGVVLKRDMPDGWTETTYVYNLEKIVEIYERNGGVKVD